MQFQQLGEVIKHLDLHYRPKMKLEEVAVLPLCPASLKDDIQFLLQHSAYDISLEALRQQLVFPVLKSVWQPFVDEFSLWVQPQIAGCEAEVDYLFTERSDYGKIVMDKPFLLVVETSLNHRNKAWTQLLWKMHQLQQANEPNNLPVFGILTNGEAWEVGKLEQNVFTQYTQMYYIGEAERLFAGLCNVLALCKKHQHLLKQTSPQKITLNGKPQPVYEVE